MPAYINLLPEEDRRKALDMRQSFVVAGSLAYLLALAGVYVSGSYSLNELRLEKEGLVRQIEMVQPSIQKLHTLEKEQKVLESRLAVGQNLSKDVYFSQLLVLISNLLPEKVTLSRMSFIEKSVSLEGESRDYRGIAELIASLKGSGNFEDVELISSFTNRHENGTIGFKITGKLTNRG